MSAPFFDNPDWIANQSWQQWRVVEPILITIPAHEVERFELATLAPGVNVILAQVAGVELFQAQSTTQDGTGQEISQAQAVLAPAGIDGLLSIPVQVISGQAGVDVYNLTGSPQDVFVTPTLFLNTDRVPIILGNSVYPHAERGLAHGVTTDPIWVPQAGLYDRAVFTVTSTRPVTVTATWHWAVNDPTVGPPGWSEAVAVEPAVVLAAPGSGAAGLAVSGTGLTYTVTNDDGTDPADVDVLVRLNGYS